MCVSTVFGLSRERPADALIRAALGDQGKDLPLARGELVDRIDLPAAREELVDDRSVDHAFPGCDPFQSVDQLLDASDPFLHQISDSPRLLVDESQRVLGLEVLRQNEDGGLWIARADLTGGAEPLVSMRRRHPNVDDGDVRTEVADAGRRASASPTWATTSTLFSASRRASPSRMSGASSAITTRMGTPRGRSFRVRADCRP